MKNDLYKGFKKVSEDDRSVTMAHPNGHKLQIAKSGLSAKLRRQLSSLPLNQAEGSEELIQSPETQSQPVDASKPVTININSNPAPPPAPPAFIPRGSQASGIDLSKLNATRQDVSPQDLQKYGSVDDAMAAQKFYQENPQPVPAAPAMRQPMEQPNPQANQNQTPIPAPPKQPVTEQPDQYESLLRKGIQEQKAGDYQAANIAGQLGEQNAQVLNNQVAQQQAALERFNAEHQALEKERQSFQRDYSAGHIDPNRLVNEMGTSKKITTAIGLLLGGIGAGIAHEARNPVLDQLNLQIDRDIKAQEENLGKKKGLLEANLRQFGNMRDATAMTRVMMNDIVSNQLKAQAEKVQGPAAKAAALKAAGVLDMQSAPLLQQLAERRAAASVLTGGGNIGQLPAQYQERAVKLPDGKFGLAFDKEAAKKVREVETAANTLGSQLDEAADLMRGGYSLPKTERSERAKTLVSSMVLEVKNLGQLGVLSEGDMKLALSMIPEPTSIFSGNQKAKLDEFRKYIDFKTESARKNNLMNYTGKPSIREAEMAYAKKNANSKDPAVRARVQFVMQKYAK